MRTRRGEVATILTVATLVVVGVTAVVSSLNLNKKQTTSSRADELCKVQLCGSLSTNGAAKYYAKYISGKWKYFKDIDCKNEAIEGVGTYCKSQNYAGGNECIARDCNAPNQAKKYYQWKTTEGGKSTTKMYSDKGVCSVEIANKEQYCKTAGGPNVTPVPGQNPPNWGVNKTAAGCGSGGVNYQFGSCYQGRRCVQCQHGGTWLSYDCFEDDSSCAGDVTYCDAPWKVTTCSNGVHKCCDAAAKTCIKSGNKPTDPTENITNCLKPAEDICNTASGEYCGGEGSSCETGDTLVSPAKICDSATNKRCCKTSNTCDGKENYKCISSSTSGATDDEKCRTAGKDHKAVYASLSCGDSNKICCYGTYVPPVDPAGDGCEKKTDTCPKDASVTYEYYQSKGAACAEGIPSSKCFGVKSDNCSLYTKIEVQKYSCDTGELPVVKCEGETVLTHTCEEYCKALSPENSKTSSSPDTEYAYTGEESSIKYWTDTTCKKEFDPVAKCDCKTTVVGAPEIAVNCDNPNPTSCVSEDCTGGKWLKKDTKYYTKGGNFYEKSGCITSKPRSEICCGTGPSPTLAPCRAPLTSITCEEVCKMRSKCPTSREPAKIYWTNAGKNILCFENKSTSSYYGMPYADQSCQQNAEPCMCTEGVTTVMITNTGSSKIFIKRLAFNGILGIDTKYFDINKYLDPGELITEGTYAGCPSAAWLKYKVEGFNDQELIISLKCNGTVDIKIDN